MGTFVLDEWGWRAVAASIRSSDGPIAWFWVAARDPLTREWQPIYLTVRGSTTAQPFVHVYDKGILGLEQLSPERAAARFRIGAVSAGDAGDTPKLSLVPPSGSDTVLRYTTEPTGFNTRPYLPRVLEWPQIISTWTLNRGNVVEPSRNEVLTGPGEPFFPSFHAALASLGFGVPSSMSGFPHVLVRLPDLRARIAGLASEDGRMLVRVDEGKSDGVSGCRLEAAWKESSTDSDWIRTDQHLVGAGAVTIETNGVPAEMWVLLTDPSGKPIDRAGWSVEGQPDTLGPIEARVEHLLSEGEHNRLEYKQALDDAKVKQSFAETVAAFANGTGGTILIGVANDSTVVGWNPRQAGDMITDIVRNSVVDPVDIDVRDVRLRGVPIWVATVSAQADEAKPFRCKDRVMVRANATTRVATTSEHRRLSSPPTGDEGTSRWRVR